ncbi:U3 small nucleolar ribonucleoprotein complex, subunit Mpp10 [Entophlyctis helioformis]|nr:U3 small nucleolar ribonucleoprotein complex, subunit Mpp10 [Entophlyctis helioformis]
MPDEDEADEEEGVSSGDALSAPKRKRSVVDDDFFSLEEMERFAEMGEKHDMKVARRASRGEDEKDDEDDDEDDAFAFESDLLNGNLEDEDEDEDALMNAEDNANDIRYEDFFEPAESKPKGKAVKKRPTWQDRDEAQYMDDVNEDESKDFGDDQDSDRRPKGLLDDDEEDEKEGAPEGPMSAFEKQQAKMQKTISALEAEALREKPWALKGEVTSKARPLNSLLEESLEVEHAARPVPVITEESTLSLQDLIIQRIKDRAWDDVVRKAPPKDTVYDPNRRMELMDEKSSKSLAQVYEDEFMRQSNKSAPTEKDEALKKKHDEITTMFRTLCHDLDALSNWHFTPKPATLELEVLPAPTVPAIQMEEVTPATVSDAKLAAPEEVYDGRVAKSQAEMEAADKRKLRVKAKRQAQKERKERDQARKLREATTGVTSAQAAKDSAVRQLMGQKNVTIVSDGKKTKDAVAAKGKSRMQATIVEKGGKVGDKVGHGARPETLRL